MNEQQDMKPHSEQGIGTDKNVKKGLTLTESLSEEAVGTEREKNELLRPNKKETNMIKSQTVEITEIVDIVR